MKVLTVGDRVRDGLGHWYDVVEIKAFGYRVRVQPLTFVNGKLFPIGVPVWSFRSDLRADGE